LTYYNCRKAQKFRPTSLLGPVSNLRKTLLKAGQLTNAYQLRVINQQISFINQQVIIN